MADTKFVDGLSFFLPRDIAPEYIKGTLTIDPKRFVEWMKANAESLGTGRNRDGETVKVFRIDLKVSQGGKSYAALNDWKPSFQPKEEGEESPW